MQKLIVLAFFVCIVHSFALGQETTVKGKRILIYTKTGEGYVHNNIAASVRAIQQICDSSNLYYKLYAYEEYSKF